MKRKIQTGMRLKVIMVALLLIGALFSSGCSIFNKNKYLNVTVHLPRQNLDESTILVFNLKEPYYAEGMGAVVAELFQLNLLETRTFKVVSLYADSPWARIADTEEKRLLQALEEAKARDFQYILVGELRDFYYGGMNESRVHMKIRIIETSTRTTVFLASNYMDSRAKDPSYPMQTKLTKRSKHPKQLAGKVVREFVKEIKKRNKRYFRKQDKQNQ
jgi:hypothetical protein